MNLTALFNGQPDASGDDAAAATAIYKRNTNATVTKRESMDPR